MNLSLKALKLLLNQVVLQGGATVDPYTLKLVDSAEWLVGMDDLIALIAPDQIAETDIMETLHRILINELKEIQRMNETKHSGKKYYLGLWMNEHRLIEIEPVIEIRDTEQAILFGLHFNQVEIYNLNRKESINLDNIKKAVK